MRDYVRELEAAIEHKPRVTEEDIRTRYWRDNGNRGVILNGQRLPTATMTQEEQYIVKLGLPMAVRAEATNWVFGGPEVLPLHDRIDRTPNQTEVRNQLDRNTCASFAVLAAMEARLKAAGQAVDLSEQFANWVVDGNQCLDFAETERVAQKLKEAGVCIEELCEYKSRSHLDCGEVPSSNAKDGADFKIGSFKRIVNSGPVGPSITNPEYLESLLARGDEIVVETELTLGEPVGGVFDVLRDFTGPGINHTTNKHAMLIVGYDRTGALPHFICKNSYGRSVGDQGYLRFSYHYVMAYAIRGLIVSSVLHPPH